jgi:hypothetical protein
MIKCLPSFEGPHMDHLAAQDTGSLSFFKPPQGAFIKDITPGKEIDGLLIVAQEVVVVMHH